MRNLPPDPPAGDELVEWLVYDGLSRCPYLPGQIARLPMRLPVRRLAPSEMAARLEAGDRRQGSLLYRPRCPLCTACEAIRLDVGTFQANSIQRRAWRSGEARLHTRLEQPSVTQRKVELYNLHKRLRGLQLGDGPIDADQYAEFLVDTCVASVELQYWLGDVLVGVAIADHAADGLSAVYCYYDPRLSGLSIGTYSILKQIELCQRLDRRYLYLGLYVAGCEAMEYKSGFLPHQRRIEGVWKEFPPAT